MWRAVPHQPLMMSLVPRVVGMVLRCDTEGWVGSRLRTHTTHHTRSHHLAEQYCNNNINYNNNDYHSNNQQQQLWQRQQSKGVATTSRLPACALPSNLPLPDNTSPQLPTLSPPELVLLPISPPEDPVPQGLHRQHQYHTPQGQVLEGISVCVCVRGKALGAQHSTSFDTVPCMPSAAASPQRCSSHKQTASCALTSLLPPPP